MVDVVVVAGQEEVGPGQTYQKSSQLTRSHFPSLFFTIFTVWQKRGRKEGSAGNECKVCCIK